VDYKKVSSSSPQRRFDLRQAFKRRLSERMITWSRSDKGFNVTSLEEIDFGHRQTSDEDSGSGRSTIIDTRHPFFATQPAKLSI
jgi:hypothetical protein